MQYEIDYTWQAQTALDSLDSGERAGVMNAIERLRQGPNPPGLPQSFPLRDVENTFVMRAGRGQRLHIVFTVLNADRITIHDVISHHLVEEYRRSVVP